MKLVASYGKLKVNLTETEHLYSRPHSSFFHCIHPFFIPVHVSHPLAFFAKFQKETWKFSSLQT